MTGDIQVLLRGGKYYLSSPLTLTESDSGFAGHDVYWQNYPGETPEIVGGTPVTGWTLDTGGIYMANVGAGLSFNALYENGTRASKARYPKTGYLLDTDGSGGIGNPTYSQAWFKFNSGDFPNWPDMVGGEVFVWGYWNWFSSTLPITAVDYVHNQVTLSRPPFWGLMDTASYPTMNPQNMHDRYFIQNVMSALSAAGEFYYNSTTGYLYYYPRNSPIGDQEIILPQMKNIIQLEGSSPSNPIQNIQIQGIRVWGSDFTHSFDSWADPANPMTSGASGTGYHFQNNEPTANRWGNIYVTNAGNITLNALEIFAAGYNGLEMDQYCQNVTVSNSQIHDVGYNGVAINGGLDNVTDTLISENNLIQNNEIYYIGELVGHGAGVHIEQSAYNNVSHNEIHDGPRYGVNIVGAYVGISIGAAAPEYNLAANNLVNYNRAYSLNTDSWDSGNFYQFAGGLNNQYDHNMSYNSYAQFTNAIYYIDNGSTETTISNNIGYNPTAVNGVTAVPFDNSGIPTNASKMPTNIITNNIASSNPADWAAAGLDSSQMGRIPTSTPARSIIPIVLLLLLNNPTP